MNKIKIFLILTGYQLTWLGCVFGESYFNEKNLGIYIGVSYLFLYFYFNKSKIRFIKLALLITIPGYFFDTILVFFNIYQFHNSFILGTLPAWMIILWLSFSTLFDEILIFLKNYKKSALVLSCTIGPITYYLGEPLEIISINNIFLFFILMVSFWFLLMFYYLELILKKYYVSG